MTSLSRRGQAQRTDSRRAQDWKVCHCSSGQTTPTRPTTVCGSSSPSRSELYIFATHGPHHVAQKSRSTTFPQKGLGLCTRCEPFSLRFSGTGPLIGTRYGTYTLLSGIRVLLGITAGVIGIPFLGMLNLQISGSLRNSRSDFRAVRRRRRRGGGKGVGEPEAAVERSQRDPRLRQPRRVCDASLSKGTMI